MPLKYRNDKTEKIIKRKHRFDNCRICGEQISPEVTKSVYCLECNLKYSNQIRNKKKIPKIYE